MADRQPNIALRGDSGAAAQVQGPRPRRPHICHDERRRAANAAHQDMEHLKDGLTKALASAADPVVKEHTELLAQAEQLVRARDWDLSRAGRGHR